MISLKQFKSLFSVADVALAFVTILIIALMVVPIPTNLLDLLMVLNVVFRGLH